MRSALSFEGLGKRVCIIGPSCSGKSTLAHALGKKAGSLVIHLDQMAFYPNTNWELKDTHLFVEEHNALIQKPQWIIEGQYSVCMPERFERATAVIWINPSRVGFLKRYLGRFLSPQRKRLGSLEGAKHVFDFDLLKQTLLKYPKKRIKYQKLIDASGVPLIMVNSMRELNALYDQLGLERHDA